MIKINKSEKHTVKLYFISFLKSLKVIPRSLQTQKSCVIEKYEDVGRNALIVYNATNTTTTTTTTTEGQK